MGHDPLVLGVVMRPALFSFRSGSNHRGVRPAVLAKWREARWHVLQAYFAHLGRYRPAARSLNMDSGTFHRLVRRAFAGFLVEFEARRQ